MKHNKVIIGFGSNLKHPVLGEPMKIIQEAIKQLGRYGLAMEKVSSFYVTKPQDNMEEGTPDFVNAVAMTSSTRPPAELFQTLRLVEKIVGQGTFHRDSRGLPISRFLDIDFLDCYGQIYHDSHRPELFLPHPRMHLRLFVLEPLWEIFPEWQHPSFELDKDRTLSQYSDQGVKKLT